MSGRDGAAVEAQLDRGYSLRGRRVEYVSPALSRLSGDRARAASGVPGGFAAGNNDRGGVGVVPESPARNDDINDVQDPTSVQPSQIPLFNSNETANVNRSPMGSDDHPCPQEILPILKKEIGYGILRVERISHHYNFLRDCEDKNVVPKGLQLDKKINPMKSRDSQNFESVKIQIQGILAQASKDIMSKLIAYYDQAVIDENDFVRSRNDRLATLELSPDEEREVGEFEANLSLKQNTIRTKLDKRRASKIEKLLHPGAERPEDVGDAVRSKKQQQKKKKQKQRKKTKGKNPSKKKKIPSQRNTEKIDPPRQMRDHDPAYQNNNRRKGPYGPGKDGVDRGGMPDQQYRGDGPDWRSRDRPGPDRHYRHPDDFGPPRDQRRHEPTYDQRYFEDRNRGFYQNEGGRSDRNGNIGGFRNPREEDLSVSLTATELLRLLARVRPF